MKNLMYSDDITWYDKGVHHAISTLSEKYSNAVPVFGGALGAYNCINADTVDIDGFMSHLISVIPNAKFFNWHEGVVGALRRFCRLCLVDPALIECYIGMSFEQLCEEHE